MPNIIIVMVGGRRWQQHLRPSIPYENMRWDKTAHIRIKPEVILRAKWLLSVRLTKSRLSWPKLALKLRVHRRLPTIAFMLLEICFLTCVCFLSSFSFEACNCPCRSFWRGRSELFDYLASCRVDGLLCSWVVCLICILLLLRYTQSQTISQIFLVERVPLRNSPIFFQISNISNQGALQKARPLYSRLRLSRYSNGTRNKAYAM